MQRLAAVRRYGILDTPPDAAFDRVAALAARIFDAPMATVSIVDEGRIWFKARVGLPGDLHETGRDPGLCASAILHDEPYVVPDARHDRRAVGNRLVWGQLSVGFYAAAQIITPDGYALGTVNVIDTKPRQVDDSDLAALRDLASVVMDELELRLSAMRTARLEHRLRQRMEQKNRDLEAVNEVLHRVLLPPALAPVPGLETSAYYHVASQDQLSGDFYDLFALADGRWAFFLGDVCGKGAAAAALTSLTRFSLRSAAVYDPEPSAVLRNLNSVLQQNVVDSELTFCTVLFGLLAPGSAGFELTLASGGHPSPLHLRRDGAVEAVETTGGQPLGLFSDPDIATVDLSLTPGDGLLLYTDGLTEARTPAGGLFGDERLRDLAGQFSGCSAQRIVTALEQLLIEFGAGLADDVAVLALTVPQVVARFTTNSTKAESVAGPVRQALAR